MGDCTELDVLFGTMFSRCTTIINNPAADIDENVEVIMESSVTVEEIKNTAAAIIRGCLQLGALKYTLVLSDGDGQEYNVDLPLKLHSIIIEASQCPSSEDIKMQLFRQEWAKYVDESPDPVVKLYKDNWMQIMNQTFTSGFQAISWAAEGLRVSDIICFLERLTIAKNSLLHKYYHKQLCVLSRIAALLKNLQSDGCDRKSILLAYFNGNSSVDTIYPIIGQGHAVYMVLLPPAEVSDGTNSLYTLILTDGSGRKTFHDVEVDEFNPKIRGHCIFQCNSENVEKILGVVAAWWGTGIIFQMLSNKIKDGTSFVRQDCHALFAGDDPLFANEKVFLMVQTTGNCGLHNLLEALWFTCAPGFRTNDFFQLRYCMVERALELLRESEIDIRDTIEYTYPDAFVCAERCAWCNLEMQFEFFNKHPEIDTVCINEIRATHASKSATDKDFMDANFVRNEFSAKVLRLIETDSMDEASLQDLFRGKLSKENLDEMLDGLAALKALYANGEPSMRTNLKFKDGTDIL